MSPWSSARHLGSQSFESDAYHPTAEVLEELTKAPVADRVNAKLAAKQLEALVSKMKSEPRSLSPANPSGISPKFTPNSSSEIDPTRLFILIGLYNIER